MNGLDDADDERSTSEIRETAVVFDDVRWTTCDVEDFERLYWDRIAPVLESDGLDPETERPTHDWLSEQRPRTVRRGFMQDRLASVFGGL